MRNSSQSSSSLKTVLSFCSSLLSPHPRLGGYTIRGIWRWSNVTIRSYQHSSSSLHQYTAATSLSFRPFSRLSFVSQFLPMGACFATLASATAVTSVFDTNSAELTTSPSIPKRILSMMITAAGRSTRYKDSGALKPLIPLVWILPVLLFMQLSFFIYFYIFLKKLHYNHRLW